MEDKIMSKKKKEIKIENGIKKYIKEYGIENYFHFLVSNQASIYGGTSFNNAKSRLMSEIEKT